MPPSWLGLSHAPALPQAHGRLAGAGRRGRLPVAGGEDRSLRDAARRGASPGEPQHYATAMDLGGVACGLLVTSYDGRPIKVEGNPKHPAASAPPTPSAQAAILELYDPDRSQRRSTRRRASRSPRTWDEFDRFAAGHFDGLRRNRRTGPARPGRGELVPTRQRLRAALARSVCRRPRGTSTSRFATTTPSGTALALRRAVPRLPTWTGRGDRVASSADFLGHPAGWRSPATSRPDATAKTGG